MLDLLLINPCPGTKIYQGLSDKSLTALEPPVWAGLTAEFVNNHGFSVMIHDTNLFGVNEDEIKDIIKSEKPRLIAIPVYGHQPSASTQNMPSTSVICDIIKNHYPDIKILLYGGHVASLPILTLNTEKCDFVSSGEGLFTIIDLLGNYGSLKSVRGLFYRDGGAIVSTNAPPLLSDLDKMMPMMHWDSLNVEHYRAHNWHCFGGIDREPYAAVYTTLGCPYHCSFCMIQAPFKSGELASGMTGNSYRRWSPEIVVDQLEYLQAKYSVSNIKIADEMFVLHPSHVKGICNLIIERKLNLNIWAYARVDTVKDGMLPLLKRAGFNWLAFGIETVNDNVQGVIDKRFKFDDMMKTLDEVKKHDINIGANYIFGLPHDTVESMQQTLDFAIELNSEYANFYSNMAYPGSRLHEEALRNKWRLPDNWSGYSQHSYDCTPLPTDKLSSDDIVMFRDDAFHSYFEGERYLSMIGDRFGNDTVDEIKDMCKYRLPRRWMNK